MKYSVWLEDRFYTVDIVEEGGTRQVYWEGRHVEIQYDLEYSRHPLSSILIEGKPYEASVRRNGETVEVNLGQTLFSARVGRGVVRRERARMAESTKDEIVKAPMPGMVVAIKVERDQEIEMGKPLLILEAMKMENELRSPVKGRVKDVYVDTGKKVEKGANLIIIQMREE